MERMSVFGRTDGFQQMPLLEEAVIEIPGELVEAKVCDLWQEGVGWMLPQIDPYITLQTRLQLVTVVIDEITGAKDRVSWGQTQNGEFSVKSAYALLTRDSRPRPNMHALFKCVWHVMAPERVRVFLWLVVNKAIMTNMERQRRHLSSTGLCQVCRGGEESILHVLRDCPAMAGIWSRIVSTRKRREFFNKHLLGWIYDNLGDNADMGGYPWSTIFAMAIWWGWKWRCWNVFNTAGKCRDRVRFLKDLAKEVSLAHNEMRTQGRVGDRTEQHIAWKPPTSGWLKVNTDGASRGNPGLATAGGVLRDEHGTWLCGFALNIGICSAPLAELWGVYYGLYMAWERRAPRVVIEVDSAIVVGFFNSGISESHPLSFLVRLCYGFLSRDWLVRVTHVYREANRVADGLANYAFSLTLGFHSFPSSPAEISDLVTEDMNGSTRARFVWV